MKIEDEYLETRIKRHKAQIYGLQKTLACLLQIKKDRESRSFPKSMNIVQLSFFDKELYK